MQDHTVMTPPDLSALLNRSMADERRRLRFAGLCAIAATAAAILLLGLSGWFIAGAALAGLAGVAAAQAFNYLLPSAAIRLLAIIRTISRYGERYHGHHAALTALAGLRSQLFDRMAAHPAPMLRISAGDIATTLMQDVDALENAIIRKPGIVGAWSAAAIGLLLCGAAGWQAVVALAVLLGLMLILMRRLSARWLATPARVQADTLAAMKQDHVEYAAASADIAAYALSSQVHAALEMRARALDDARLIHLRREAAIAAIPVVIGGMAMALVIALSQADIPLTLLATLAAAGAVEGVSGLALSYPRDMATKAAGHRITALLAADEEPAPPTAVRPAGHEITFAYGSQRTTVRSGECLALVGRSGSGKTSLIECLAGLRDSARPVDLSIDGLPVGSIPPDERSALFALTAQNAPMIAGTVRDNLLLARPGLTDADLWEALDTACLAEEIRAMPDGMESWIGDAGARLSGGQRKRLALTRALLARRPWLLLDEPSEGLDASTEDRLCRALASWLDRTNTGLILTSHRQRALNLTEKRFDL
jgi:ATP-binding cassette subfamily C protein CydC